MCIDATTQGQLLCLYNQPQNERINNLKESICRNDYLKHKRKLMEMTQWSITLSLDHCVLLVSLTDFQRRAFSLVPVIASCTRGGSGMVSIGSFRP